MTSQRAALMVLCVIALAGCDRSSSSAVSATRPAGPAGLRRQTRQEIASTRPAATQPSDQFNAVELKPPAEMVAQIVEWEGFDPFQSCAIALHDLNTEPKLVTNGRTKIHVDTPGHQGTYEVDVQEMARSRRQVAGWIKLRGDNAPNECRMFFDASWDDASPTTATAAPIRFDAPVPVKVTWLGPTLHNRVTGTAIRIATPSAATRPAPGGTPSP